MKIPKPLTKHLLANPGLYEPKPIRIKIKSGKKAKERMLSFSVLESAVKCILGRTVWALRADGIGVRVVVADSPWWLPRDTFSIVKNINKK